MLSDAYRCTNQESCNCEIKVCYYAGSGVTIVMAVGLCLVILSFFLGRCTIDLLG